MTDTEKRMQVLCRNAIALIELADKNNMRICISTKADLFSMSVEDTDLDFSYVLQVFCSEKEIVERDRTHYWGVNSFRSFESAKDILIKLREVFE